MDATSGAIILGVVTQLATVFIIMFNSRIARQRREAERRWDVEDRAVLARKVEDTREELAAKVLTTGEALTQHVTEVSSTLSGQVDQAIDAAHSAYKEANAVNSKISDLNARIAKQQDVLDTKQ